MNTKGFTLVEIMIVVAIIGLLAAIAIPNFVNARTTAIQNTCQANERTLQGLVEIAVFEGNLASAASQNSTALTTALVTTYTRQFPTCPDGTYGTDASGIVDCTGAH